MTSIRKSSGIMSIFTIGRFDPAGMALVRVLSVENVGACTTLEAMAERSACPR